jgi:hypothetical protein
MELIMKKGFIQISAVCALCMIMAASCGRPPIPEPDPPYTTTVTETTTTVTETSTTPPETTTLPPPPETTTTTPPPETTTTTAPPEPEDTYPPVAANLPVKHYEYSAPYYTGLTHNETVDYYDDGRIIASSHGNKDGLHAGFSIDYIPGDYLTIAYTTSTTYAVYAGKQTMIDLDLSEGFYGEIYIGETINGRYQGEGYFFDKYSEPDCGWYTYDGNYPVGTGYVYEDGRMYIREYDYGDIIAQTEIPLTENSAGENVFVISEEDGLEFYVGTLLQSFQVDTVLEYFAYADFDDGTTYRGQMVDNDMWGPGIYTWDDGDVLIGHFENGDVTYGYYYEAGDDTSYFVKNVDGEMTISEEIEGIDIDFADFLGTGE